jgi:hypothetical protein
MLEIVNSQSSVEIGHRQSSLQSSFVIRQSPIRNVPDEGTTLH